MYIKLTNGVPENYSIGELRRDNPQVSFPKKPNNDLLATYSVFPLKATGEPQYEELTQNCVEITAVQIEGVWTQQWAVENKPEVLAAKNVRKERNRLLAGCDWTQVSDAPVDQSAWASYRQALRDITTQEGFPYSVTWPEEP